MDDDLEEMFFGSKKKINELVTNLYATPKKDKKGNAATFQDPLPNVVQQADLLYMPEDDGYKYALVVVDIGSRMTDAEPLKNHDAASTLKAFKTIYGRKILKKPETMEVDSGSEFKGAVAKWFKDEGIYVRVSKTGRHRQQAIVERKNQQIAKALFRRMSAQQLLTGAVSKEWIEDLPKLIKILNTRSGKRKVKKLKNLPTAVGDSANLLFPETKVRVALEMPKDEITGKRLVGKFRTTDQRWSADVRTVKQVIIKPNSPPLYLLNGTVGKLKIDPVGYTKNQLQVIEENEKWPSPKVIRGKPTSGVPEKIMGKKTEKRRIYYHIKWRSGMITWEPATVFRVDKPQMVAEYEAALKQIKKK